MSQIWPNWSKMTQKMVENHKNYTRIFYFLPKMADFWPLCKCQKHTVLFCLFIFMKVGIILQNYIEVRNCYRNAWPYFEPCHLKSAVSNTRPANTRKKNDFKEKLCRIFHKLIFSSKFKIIFYTFSMRPSPRVSCGLQVTLSLKPLP